MLTSELLNTCGDAHFHHRKEKSFDKGKTCLIESTLKPIQNKTKSRFYQILIKRAKLVKISLPCVQVISVFFEGDATDRATNYPNFTKIFREVGS